MKRFFAVILTAALIAAMFTVPVFAAGSSVLATFPAQGDNASYSVWDFAKASNAQTAVSSPDVYQPLDDSALSASQGGLTIKSEASDSNNGVSIMDVPEGSFWAKIVYKFDSVSLTSDASGDIEGSASIISGSTIVDFAKFSVSNGEKAASVTNAAGKPVEPGKFTSSVVKLDDVKDYMTVSPTYFDGELADSSFTIAYIAFFGTEEAANAYDPSVESVSVESVPTEIDIFKHTASAQFAQGVTEEEMALSPESYMFELTHLGVSASAKSETAAVTKDSKGVTAVMHFDITAIDGTVNDWEITVVSPKSPATDQNGITPYAIIDSSNIDDIVVADGSFDKAVASDGGKDVIKLSNPSAHYFRFNVNNTNAESGVRWYIKTKFRFSESTTFEDAEKQFVRYQYGGDGWEAIAGNFSKDYTFSTYAVTAKTTDILNVLFQGFDTSGAELYIEYIALFKNASDAANYDEETKYGGGEINGIKPDVVINGANIDDIVNADSGASFKKEVVTDGEKDVIKLSESSKHYFRFNVNNTNAESGVRWYIKTKFRFSKGTTFRAAENQFVKYQYGGAGWDNVSGNFSNEYTFNTYALTTTDTSILNVLFQGFEASGAELYIEYIALFKNASDAANYDEETKYGGGEINGIKPDMVVNGANIDDIVVADGSFKKEVVTDGEKDVIKLSDSSKHYFRFNVNNTNAESGVRWYIKTKFRFSEGTTFRAAENQFVKYQYGGAGWDNVSGNFSNEYTFNTYALTATDTSILNVLFQGFEPAGAELYIEYIALFKSEADAADYDQPASPKLVYNEKQLDIDRDSKTVTLVDEPKRTADDIRASVFEIVNSDVFSFSDDWEETTEGKYLVMKKTLVDSTDSANTWTLVVKSKNQYEALDVIDFTDRASSELRISSKSGNLTPDWHKIGNQDAFYFGGTLAEYWCGFKTSGVDMTKRPYVKIAYRLGENTEFTSGKSGLIRLYATNPKGYKTMVTVPNTLADNYTGHWNTVIYQLPDMAKSDDEFLIETVDMNTIFSVKYIAFFETETEARNYTFGDADAHITADGNNVTAAFDNIEDLGSSTPYLVLYKDSKIAAIKSAQDKDILTADSLSAGTYTAKAFVIHNSTLKPMMNAVSETIKIE